MCQIIDLLKQWESSQDCQSTDNIMFKIQHDPGMLQEFETLRALTSASVARFPLFNSSHILIFSCRALSVLASIAIKREEEAENKSIIFASSVEVYLPFQPSCLTVGWLVDQSHKSLKGFGSYAFNVPIRAHVTYVNQ